MSPTLPKSMRAMRLHSSGSTLISESIDVPIPAAHQVLIKVEACGICRTDLHIVDGDLTEAKLPLVPGHEIVGRVHAAGDAVQSLNVGDRVGVGWLGYTCGECRYCRSGSENLCDNPLFTGYTTDGGFAEYCVADARYAFPMSDDMDPVRAAPLLCAGLIGYRSWRKLGAGIKRVGLYGFGAAAHILIQVARHEGIDVYAFVRPGDERGAEFARECGATWAGPSTELPPAELDGAIIFAPVGSLVPAAMRAVRKGGRVVCGGIHMSDIPSFPYSILWGERSVVSVANLQIRDGEEFLPLAADIPVETSTTEVPLEDVNDGLDRLRHGEVDGALVVVV